MSDFKKTDVIDPVLIDVPMPIHTPRLILRPVMPGDGAATAEAISETWESLNRWMDWAADKAHHTPEKQEIRARKVYAQFILREDIPLIGIERESGQPVIWTGLHRGSWPARQFEIGYWVRKSAQGKGYASESTNALLRYGFNALSARRITIRHAVGNEASARVIARLGFIHEGMHRAESHLPGGAFVDTFHYARLDAENLPPLAVRWGEELRL